MHIITHGVDSQPIWHTREETKLLLWWCSHIVSQPSLCICYHCRASGRVEVRIFARKIRCNYHVKPDIRANGRLHITHLMHFLYTYIYPRHAHRRAHQSIRHAVNPKLLETQCNRFDSIIIIHCAAEQNVACSGRVKWFCILTRV